MQQQIVLLWAIKRTHVTTIHQGTFVPKSTLGKVAQLVENFVQPQWESNLRPQECYRCSLPTELRGQDGSLLRYFRTGSSSFYT